MDHQAERIMKLEEKTTLMCEASLCNTLASIGMCKNIEHNTTGIALNAETIASFERTIANMQAQIDGLKAKEASDE
jgi:hypothetical protein